jgi:hypothetical protein
MERKKYHLCFDKAEKYEKDIRRFLLSSSDVIRVTEHHWTEVKLFKITKYGGEHDERFMAVVKELKPFFIKKIINNEKYEGIVQSKKAEFTHYFYKLSPKFKKMLCEDTIIWLDAAFSKNFYGFEDPTFFKKNTMIGSVISHEPIISLYLTDKEKKELDRKGVMFD